VLVECYIVSVGACLLVLEVFRATPVSLVVDLSDSSQLGCFKCSMMPATTRPVRPKEAFLGVRKVLYRDANAFEASSGSSGSGSHRSW
jgi:hypothetical protein